MRRNETSEAEDICSVMAVPKVWIFDPANAGAVRVVRQRVGLLPKPHIISDFRHVKQHEVQIMYCARCLNNSMSRAPMQEPLASEHAATSSAYILTALIYCPGMEGRMARIATITIEIDAPTISTGDLLRENTHRKLHR
jgi:hypothetical protein